MREQIDTLKQIDALNKVNDRAMLKSFLSKVNANAVL
jgi:hypothetical protein